MNAKKREFEEQEKEIEKLDEDVRDKVKSEAQVPLALRIFGKVQGENLL